MVNAVLAVFGGGRNYYFCTLGLPLLYLASFTVCSCCCHCCRCCCCCRCCRCCRRCSDASLRFRARLGRWSFQRRTTKKICCCRQRIAWSWKKFPARNSFFSTSVSFLHSPVSQSNGTEQFRFLNFTGIRTQSRKFVSQCYSLWVEDDLSVASVSFWTF